MLLRIYPPIALCISALLLWFATPPFLRLRRDQIVLQPVASSAWHVWTGWPLQKPLATPRRHGYFLHITDIHADNEYLNGATVKSACHRPPTALDLLRKEPLGSWLGAPGERCDSPLELAKQTFDWIGREWRDKIDFVIWTGDNSRHDWDSKNDRSRRQIVALNRQVNDMVIDTFGEIPVVPCLGNNDVYPHNEVVANDDMLLFYESLWRQWIPVDQRTTFRRGGYFATDLGGFRIIALNTMYFFNRNTAVKSCHSRGPARDHMAWFNEELRSAQYHGKPVLIMGHVPPSPRDYRKACFNDYVRITAEHADIIVGQLFGHLNMDHFLIYSAKQSVAFTPVTATDSEVHAERDVEEYVEWLRDMYESVDLPGDGNERVPDTSDPPEDTRLSVIHVTPSVLPIYVPTLRIYRYAIRDDQDPQSTDDLSASLLGYKQFYANISQFQEDSGPLEYTLEYDTKEEYDLDDLSAESISSFIKEMIDGNDQLWTTYARNIFIRTHNDSFPVNQND